jgi:hypothetical protein
MLPVQFVPAGKYYGLLPEHARALLANIEAMQICIAEYQLWGKEVEKCLRR